MKKFAILAATAASLAMAGTAHAGNAEGKLQVKLLGTAVIADGKVTAVKNDTARVVAGGIVGDTRASDNKFVPTVAVEYFFTPNISLETICCVTAHHVSAAAGAVPKGTAIVDNVQIIPATFTAKYHLPLGMIKPYVGAGPTLFIMLNDRPSVAVQGLGVTRTHLSSELGVAVQAGADIAIGNGYSLSLDAKKYWVSTDATFYTATGATALQTRHRLNPWVLSAGLAYRF